MKVDWNDNPWQYIGEKVRVCYHDEPEWDSVILAVAYVNAPDGCFIVERIDGGDRVGIDRRGKQVVIPSDAWSVRDSQVELLESLKPIKPVVLYPHKCKCCKSPARINRAITLCSNVKCKTWKLIRKQAAIGKAQVKPDRNKQGVLFCPECNGPATSWDDNVAFCGEFNDLDPSPLYGHNHMWNHKWQDEEGFVATSGHIYRFKNSKPYPTYEKYLP